MKEKMIDLMAETFDGVKTAYISCREQQRQLIMDHIAKSFKPNRIVRNGNSGMGNKSYQGSLSVPYDLRNWKWIEIYKGEMYYFISLQAFDQDPNSLNFHALTDRLGIFSCTVTKRDSVIQQPDGKKQFNKLISAEMQTTTIDLPMNEEKLERLVYLLDQAK